MTVLSEAAQSLAYAPDGVVKVFAFPFAAQSADEVEVVRVAADGTESVISDYSVALNAGGAGGAVTFATAPTAGDPLYVRSAPDFLQQADFENQGNWSPEAIDGALDRTVIRDLVLKRRIDKVLADENGFLAAIAAYLVSTRDAQGQAASSVDAIASFVAANAMGSATVPAASRAILAGMGTSLPVYLTESGREGTFVWSAADHSAHVTADTAQGVFVPPTGQTGATGAWVRKHGGVLNIQWFGAKADDTGTSGTDNLPFINAALSCAAAIGVADGSGYVGVPSIYVPAGRYYVSALINLKCTVRFFGESSGQGNVRPASWLRFPSGSAGIVINMHTSLGYTDLGTPTTFGAGSIVERLGLQGGLLNTKGGGASYDATAQADGILMRGRGVIRDCWIEGFKRAGIAILAGSDGNPILGNANNWIVERCAVYWNGLHGLWVKGSDANAGVATQVDASFNRRWGIRDESFLGNSYVACHAANNGLAVDLTDIDSVCCYPGAGATRYYVVEGMETAAATTVPGTDDGVWRKVWMTGGLAVDGRPWTPGFIVRSGGPYYGNCWLFGCYAEDAQGASQRIAGRMFGLHGPPIIGDMATYGADTWAAPEINGDAVTGSITTARGFEVRPSASTNYYGTTITVGGGLASGDILNAALDPDVASLRLYYNSAGWYAFDAAHNNFDMLRITAQGTTLTFGRGTPQEYKTQIDALFVGPGDNARLITNDGGNGVPTTGAHARGDIVFAMNAGGGNPVGWRCTAAGTPGTWEAFGVDMQAATSSSTYAAPSGGTTVDTEGRASLAQLAADVADMRAKFEASGLMA